jgi:hypothetical protein
MYTTCVYHLIILQEDLADFLAQYVLNIQKIKKMTPESNTQAILFKNCLKVSHNIL